MQQTAPHAADTAQRAHEMAEVVEAAAQDAEQQRSLTPEVVEALKQTGLLALCLPEAFRGGPAARFTDMLTAWEETARQDASTGWTHMANCTATAFCAAYLPGDAARSIFANGKGNIVVGGQFFPNGTASEEAGGYRLSGNWRFGSGTGHSDFIAAGFLLMRDGAPVMLDEIMPDMRVAVLPREQVDFKDGWHVMGLKGTGSFDYAVEALFVPEDMTFALQTREPNDLGGALFKLGVMTITAAGHAAFALGVGRRALDEVREMATTRQRMSDATPLAQRVTFQKDLGIHEAAMRAARCFVFSAFDAIERALDEGREVTTSMRADVRLATTHATEVAAKACDFAQRYAGSEAIRDGSVIERCFRDVHTATQHAFVSENTYIEAAKAMLGISDNPYAL